MEVIEIIKIFLLNNIEYGYYIIFTLIMVVNIFPFGLIIYPQIILVISVFLLENSPIGYSIILVLIIGSIIGETISYFLGKLIGKKILKNRKKQKKYIKKVIISIKKNPIKTIFIGKFTPVIFAFIPLLSGITKINFFKFFIINAITTICAILYIGFIMLIGFKSINFILFQDNYLLIILGIILLFATIFYIFKKKKLGKSFD